MNEENKPLVTYELVEFEKKLVEVQDFIITIDGIYLISINENPTYHNM
jgi:hypothetical protein